MGSSSKGDKDKDKDRDREKDKERHRHHHHHHHHHHRDRVRGRDEAVSKDKDRAREERRLPDDRKARKRRESSEELADSPPPAKISKSLPRVKEEPRSSPSDDEAPPQTSTSGGEISMSIEETNKLRAKLGLKPLAVEGDSSQNKGDGDGSEEIEYEKRPETFVKTENISEKLEQQKLRERLEAQREKRKVLQRLQRVRKIVDDNEEEDDDPLKWIEKTRKIEQEKLLAEKRAKELEELDAQILEAKRQEEILERERRYTAKDVRGLKVGHSSEAIAGGEQIILTLDDRGVLDDGEDVLINVNLVDEERAKENLKNKLKGKDYKPYDEPEYDEFGILKPKTMLSKYDEEIEGKKKDFFTLGGRSNEEKEKEQELIRLKLMQQQGKITLDMPAPKLANEYLTPEEMAFKKPRKKVKKVLRKKDESLADELAPIPGTSTDSDLGSRSSRKIKQEPMDTDKRSNRGTLQPKKSFKPDRETLSNEDEDDLAGVIIEDEAVNELESVLERARKMKMMENKKEQRSEINYEKLAEIGLHNIKQEAENEYDEPWHPSTSTSQNKSITLNATAEFCRNLGEMPTYGLAGNRMEDDDILEFERELEEEAKMNRMTKDEDMDLDFAEPSTSKRGTWNEVDMEADDNQSRPEFETVQDNPILEEEPDVSKGVAGALQLATKKGYLEKEQTSKGAALSARTAALQAQSYTIEEKFYEDDKMSKRERYSGPVQEFRDKAGYTPNVKLEYIDDDGRILNQKEAFRYLSHKFHGKGPGKNKIDKRMKKIEQDSKLKMMSSTDTPLNTLKLLQEKQKQLNAPYIVLSGQNPTLKK